MRKVAKILSMPLAFVYLFVSTISCTTNDVSKENELLLDSAKSNSKKAVSLFLEINNNLSARSEYSRAGLTQEIIDEYLVNAGFQAGSVTLETINAITTEIGEMEGMTFEEKIDLMSFSDLVKSKLLEMKESGYIENLESQSDFQNLLITEKEFLLNANEMVNEFSKADFQDANVPCPGSSCTWGFILVGASIGAGLCGPWCGFVGGVLGLIIGVSSKQP